MNTLPILRTSNVVENFTDLLFTSVQRRIELIL